MRFALAVVRSRGTRTSKSIDTSSAVLETVMVVVIVFVLVILAVLNTSGGRILLPPRLLSISL